MVRYTLQLTIVSLLSAACGAAPSQGRDAPGPIDPQATPETRALFAGLAAVADSAVLFGHQDDLAYGVTWWDEPGRSDVKEVTGAYPALFGWELGRIEKSGAESLDRVPFDRIRDWMVQAYELGGVNTVSWHADNPVSDGDAWDTEGAVAAILPGGAQHDLYRSWLDTLAGFFLSVRAPGGERVPIVFRPFHEMSGDWFWWGAGHVTPEEYRSLWRFTVEYLRDDRGVHNLLYAYSPGWSVGASRDTFWTWYPGDEYVDVLGFDAYLSNPPAVSADLAWLAEEAAARGKIPAFTETGYETVPDPDWWTDQLLAAFTGHPGAERIGWVLVWRNANEERDRAGHFYAPYPGHPSAENFVRFKEDPLIRFADELPDLYRGAP